MTYETVLYACMGVRIERGCTAYVYVEPQAEPPVSCVHCGRVMFRVAGTFEFVAEERASA